MVPSSPLPASPAPRPAFARWMGTTNQITRTFLAAGAIPDLINVAGGLPDPDVYPTERMAEIARRAVAEHPDEVLGYGPVEGLPALRDALARRLGSPALPLTRDNVLVTTSGMQALDLVGKVLLDEGGLIAGQHPTYLGALDAWRPRSPTFRNLVLDAPGFDAHRALTGAQFAYAVPNFSNPTGRLVGLETRRALVAAAHDTGTWLVEDDPYGTLLYDGAPLPRLIELSAQAAPGAPYAGPVVSMGTLSKEIAPGLRVGWIVAAPAMIQALTLAKQGSDLCTSGVTQRIALAAIETGLIEAIRPAVVALYRARRDALCAALEAHLSAWFTWEVPVGGMFVWATAKDPGLDTDALLPHALKAGICYAPSSVFDASGANRRGMRINFTLNRPERLDEGMRRLGLAVAALRGAA
ncbi:PLP-dependent aminotransferase family protein [Methylobacterium frigidaeris]|uniref:8-amino-7-oxononanoate synthase n=2 Tax=Methylobacterium frigidaeris TaxID=2038277 RepID=A0AA37HAG9_9HYPH|nr:PLP-dependent aminotransferase family protein [Methylobacterium frigidaeris]PIK72740.1 aminotransferase [Methylobacterium frigidaeris]GJD61999.1 2-aminoadipate transaminase [Methylobacterium frigidaeris]